MITPDYKGELSGLFSKDTLKSLNSKLEKWTALQMDSTTDYEKLSRWMVCCELSIEISKRIKGE